MKGLVLYLEIHRARWGGQVMEPQSAHSDMTSLSSHPLISCSVSQWSNPIGSQEQENLLEQSIYLASQDTEPDREVDSGMGRQREDTWQRIFMCCWWHPKCLHFSCILIYYFEIYGKKNNHNFFQAPGLSKILSWPFPLGISDLESQGVMSW